MAPTLHQSLLMVTDLNESIEFYRDIVGMEPDEIEDGNAEFESGQCTLVLEEDFDQEVLDVFGLTEPGDPRGEGVIVAIEVDDTQTVDEVCDRVESGGYTVRMEPREVSWGRQMALVADPDDYTVEISAPL